MSANPFQTLPTASQAAGQSSALPQTQTSNSSDTTKPARKRKGHRGGKKKRSRRKSFAVLDDDGPTESEDGIGSGLYQNPNRNLSETSLDSEALLDHRGHQPLRPRRSSTAPAPIFNSQGGFPPSTSRLRSMQTIVSAGDNESTQWNESAPLLGDSRSRGSPTTTAMGGYGTSDARSARRSNRSSPTRLGTSAGQREQYDINNPPSVPGSPRFGAADRMDINFGDAMLRDELSLHDASPGGRILDYDAMSEAGAAVRDNRPEMGRRLPTVAEKDVCFPGPGMSEVGDDETQSVMHERVHKPRRRRGPWPDLSALEDFSRLEKEGRTEERRVKKVIEPQLINGRLRPVRKGWSQSVEESPYRFTYFNEDLQSTIHSQTISELVQPGGSFQELFIPDPPILSDSDDSDVEMDPLTAPAKPRESSNGQDGESRISTRQPSMATSREELRPDRALSPSKDQANNGSRSESGRVTPSSQKHSDDSIKPTQTTTTTAVDTQDKAIRYGDRPVWWLDVLCPTEEEMRVLTKAFGIHPLTAEDILVQDPREKVELFRNYYFVNYRTFNQDSNSETFLDPVEMYVIVFREGVISFHFALTPHAANVRRRIRQLQDYVFVSSDWISYALIDDITDAFQPLAKNIEMEVDEIDDKILLLHSNADQRLKEDKFGSGADDASSTNEKSSGDMLQRVGDCRKRVMNLYRLLGNKADVIKGFAKRCNERWDVAPRSDIGLYLGDIQDHIVTMTSNLNHYEGILARAHANYLAQINILMNERQEQTADVLGKLTVLGTIVLPMNIITGLWGMNVWVPGQEYEGDLTWFICITGGLLVFGIACYLIAKRVYNIM